MLPYDVAAFRSETKRGSFFPLFLFSFFFLAGRLFAHGISSLGYGLGCLAQLRFMVSGLFTIVSEIKHTKFHTFLFLLTESEKNTNI